MNTILKGLRNRILKDIYEISFVNNPAELAYQAALEKHADHLPILSPTDLDIVETIKREGVCITSLEALAIPSSEKVLHAAKTIIPQIPRSISGDKNEYVVHASSEQIMEYPEIFLWGLEQRLLNIAENYLGLPVAYHGAYFRRDIANDVEVNSRLWHIDREDRKLIKIIIYLHDVGEDGGPFQYIPQYFTSTIANALKYKYGYIREKTMQQVISPSHWKSCTGSAGTVVFAGTGSIFHRGKTPADTDRFTIFFDYSSSQPRLPFYCKSSLPQEDLTLLTQKLSPYHRKYVFWRE